MVDFKILSKKYLPKNFFFLCNLEKGSFIVGIIYLCVTFCSIIALIVNVTTTYWTWNVDSPQQTWKNAYAIYITGILYCLCIVLLDVWFLWALKKNKTSVMLCWVVISGMWLAQTFCLLLVLITMYNSEVNFISWLLSLIFGLICIALLLYMLLVVLAYWMQLKTTTGPVTTAN